ncbi:hypothetical protein [Sphingomonas sp.]|uniref:hypothetical protein n=1 Tax=Sphingomonas sp. TaxID=28214 RepID=UPI002BA485C5|nr:hypothetical protein [Sphingomonas sp.]HTG37489.1 hypothetical protein [Sphingomonas sp.]
MARGPDAGTLVERALSLSAMRASIAMVVLDATATRWASATFSGARHVLDLRLSDTAAARQWLAGLAEADLPMRGHLMADCTVAHLHSAGGTIDVRIEALTVESV